MKKKRTFIAYYRVSTQKQGQSGLGLEAQQAIVNSYIESVGGTLIEPEYIDVVSGRYKERISVNQSISLDTLLKNRPKLLEAIKQANKFGATLIAKDISRIGRHSLLINYLIDSKVNFTCADYPNDSDMMLKFRANILEEEAKQTSEKTTQALKAKIVRFLESKGFDSDLYFNANSEQKKAIRDKFNDWPLGNDNTTYRLTESDRVKGNEKRRFNARENKNNKQAVAFINLLIKNDNKIKTAEIVRQLNENGYQSSTGKIFHRTTVERLIKRYKIAKYV